MHKFQPSFHSIPHLSFPWMVERCFSLAYTAPGCHNSVGLYSVQNSCGNGQTHPASFLLFLFHFAWNNLEEAILLNRNHHCSPSLTMSEGGSDAKTLLGCHSLHYAWAKRYNKSRRGSVEAIGSQQPCASLHYEKNRRNDRIQKLLFKRKQKKNVESLKKRERLQQKMECERGFADPGRCVQEEFLSSLMICMFTFQYMCPFMQQLLTWNNLSHYSLQLRKALTKRTMNNEKLSLKIS